MGNKDIVTASVNQNLSTCLKNTEITNLSVAIHKMAIAKNIKLMDGTLTVWIDLINEDILNKRFRLEDILKAISIYLRKPSFNRLDYADIYQIAWDLYSDRDTL